ncbi:D-glycero-beta-D-manno-heptose 1-phosphate adenylyltransferase [candidate division KSB1 bacterium]|nr:D-glycero-beta-D-manno-heptose 1-phosphate adenylyltransferase [candidate division KSB1 bacterium]
MAGLEGIVEQFQNKNVLVIGDLFLDEHIYGDMLQISKEGPIPVVTVTERAYFPSAAGYIALALKALGLEAHVIGFVGHDTNGKLLIDELLKRHLNIDGVFIHEKMKTCTKIRISAGGKHTATQELLRVDYIQRNELPGDWQQQLIRALINKIDIADAIILVDKLSIIINQEFMRKVVEIAKQAKKPIIADSERLNNSFRHFDLIVANDVEASTATNIPINDLASLEAAGTQLIRAQDNANAVITRGAEDMAIFGKDGEMSMLPVQPQKVFNARGVGEIVAATLTAAMTTGASVSKAAELANHTAGLAIKKSGIPLVLRDELLRAIRQHSQLLDIQKLVTLDELKSSVDQAKLAGKKVVWTNGCFDIMHVGHILYLEKAKAYGDLLIVGLNSDASIKLTKGPTRPIVEESQRAKLLSSLSCVDYIIIFSEKTPMKLLEILKPDVYVKGGDYTLDTINQEERRFIESYGGTIELMPGIDGMSTSALIKRILKAHH